MTAGPFTILSTTLVGVFLALAGGGRLLGKVVSQRTAWRAGEGQS